MIGAWGSRYPEEKLCEDIDDGTIVDNVNELASQVIGSRIIDAQRLRGETVLTLDTGKQVVLKDSSDCCAFTYLDKFLLHPDRVDHVILGVGTTGDYTTWHIYADLGDVLELSVEWSCGNPFYYGYGFDIEVRDGPVTEEDLAYVRASLGNDGPEEE